MPFKRAFAYGPGKIASEAAPGDAFASGIATALTTVGAGVILGAAIVGGIVLRTASGGAVSDTTDTANNIYQALMGNTGDGPRVGETFEWQYSNQTGSIMTLAGGTGVTPSGTLATAVGSMKTVLMICTNEGTKTFANGLWTVTGATFNMIAL